ncbi:putative ribonuclease H-like domain-containing protein [Tanacetum coccineum]|uniref:Ribonuclease H-like domain-containing protein n=1 Tax=Tanacetum coccineum TaxID=301880 RepID=A0ABQ4XMR0_9ASTR
MDLMSAQNNTIAKLPLLKQGDYEMWRLRIEQYIQLQDYALWEIIENGNSFIPVARTTTHADGTSTSIIPIQSRFGGNDATKKTQKTLLKQTYENFNASSSESLTSSSTSPEIVRPKCLTKGLKHGICIQLLEVQIEDTTHIPVSTASTPVSTASTSDNAACLSDATVYAFLANQPHGSQSVHKDLEQIHDDDLEEMDLKWQLALLKQESKKDILLESAETLEVKMAGAMLAVDGAGFDWSFMAEEEVPTNMALMAFSDSEVQKDKTCSSICLKSFETLKTQYDKLRVEYNKTEFDLANYKRALASVEEHLPYYKQHEATSLIDNNKKGLGYNVVPPPLMGLFVPPLIDLSHSGIEKLSAINFVGYGVKVDKIVSENSSVETKKTSDAPIIEDWVSDCEEDEIVSKVSGKVPISTARQSSPRAAVPISIARPVNTAAPKSLVNGSSKGGKISGKGTIRTGIENQLNHRVKIIRSDNGTEFKNQDLNQFCNSKGIKREYSNARTPQQNGVAERKNRTLIEAARTMLVDSLLPIPFWAEAVDIACYVQNRVLVTKPHNKTPYELLIRKPPIKFMRPFRCPVSILNTLDHLGKFDGKADEGVLVGYSIRNGLKWLFDIDSLTNTMNYHPVSARNRANVNACIETRSDTEQAKKEKVPDQEYILLPLLHTSSYGPSTFEEAVSSPHDDVAGKKINQDPTIEEDHTLKDDVDDMLHQEKMATKHPDDARSQFKEECDAPLCKGMRTRTRSTNNFNTVRTPLNTANINDYPDDPLMPELEDTAKIHSIGIFGNAYDDSPNIPIDDQSVGAEADFNNMEPSINDKYVVGILKKFDFWSIRTASTPIESNKPLVKDEDGKDIDVHVYRSMIGSLMDSPLKLEAFSESDYGGASLDRKLTTGGCQFLGRRLISWQCKKQTIMANSTTEVEYVAAANYCGQVLWIQSQMMDYGFNFMHTKIHIDNESTISVIKNPVAHSRTKHIEIRFHFIRDCYEKRLIEVIKIHTDSNVADLLTKGFDVTRFNFLVVSIRMLNL